MKQVSCAACFGDGKIECTACSATGQSGSLAWADISLAVEHKLRPAESAPTQRAQIEKLEGGIEGLAKISRISSPLPIGGHNAGAAIGRIIVSTFEVDIFRLTVECDGLSFEVAAYGPEKRWLSTGGIVEHLLEHDLSGLETAIIDAGKQGWTSRERASVCDALSKVLSSEINVAVLTSKQSTGGVTPESVALSPKYTERLDHATNNAFRLIDIRQAKDVSWRLCIGTLVATLLGWALFGSIEAGAIGLMAISAGEIIRGVLAKRYRSVLSLEVLANGQVAQLGRGKLAELVATGVVVIPAALTLAALLYILPSERPWERKEAEPTSIEHMNEGDVSPVESTRHS
jgi:hypothetical protein